jgi:hypothetical protein
MRVDPAPRRAVAALAADPAGRQRRPHRRRRRGGPAVALQAEFVVLGMDVLQVVDLGLRETPRDPPGPLAEVQLDPPGPFVEQDGEGPRVPVERFPRGVFAALGPRRRHGAVASPAGAAGGADPDGEGSSWALAPGVAPAAAARPGVSAGGGRQHQRQAGRGEHGRDRQTPTSAPPSETHGTLLPLGGRIGTPEPSYDARRDGTKQVAGRCHFSRPGGARGRVRRCRRSRRIPANRVDFPAGGMLVRKGTARRESTRV